VQERLAVAAELRRTAQAVGDPELELEGMGWTVVNLLERGDMAAADLQIAAATALAERTQRPLYLWWTSLFACTRAQIAGDFEAAEKLALSTLTVGRRGQAENAMHYFAIALFNIRREQGRLGEVEEAVRGYIELYPAVPAWRCALAALHAELGRDELAREELGRLVAAGGVAGLPRDANWLIAVTLLADVVVRLRAVDLAAPLYEALEPYAGRNVVVGRAATCNGAAARFLGLLATALGEFDVAERHLAAALEMHESMGARPLAIRTRLAQAELALARGDDGAAPLLAAVARAAAPLGMEAVRARAEALGAGLGAAASGAR
jgi:tetratricopeptide (TPR) repeat protein